MSLLHNEGMCELEINDTLMEAWSVFTQVIRRSSVSATRAYQKHERGRSYICMHLSNILLGMGRSYSVARVARLKAQRSSAKFFYEYLTQLIQTFSPNEVRIYAVVHGHHQWFCFMMSNPVVSVSKQKICSRSSV
ncbi:hypothetical protein XENORESO_016315 [Xenotaenia resolanae]|uniref:Uncharacterized protein n=1 Tax=Xenotaenia resolanae TaxID=208358 RepID=A0ABV0X9E1_9TELE